MNTSNGLSIGFGWADITPSRPAVNYLGKLLDVPTQGLPGLECVAALLGVGRAWVGLVAVDSTWISRELVLRIREEVKTAADFLDVQELIVAATHTHSAPPLGPGFLSGAHADCLYEDRVIVAILDALRQAKRSLCPAKLKTGIAEAPGFEFNRRLLRPDGRIITTMADDLEDALLDAGPVDKEVPFWWFEFDEQKPLGVVISYPSHNNATRSSYPYFSPDIGGFCRSALRECFGSTFATLFLEGACGDVSWINPRKKDAGGIAHAERIGKALAKTIIESVDKARAVDVHQLAYRTRTMRIPDRPLEQSSFCQDDCRGSSEKAREIQRKRYDLERKYLTHRVNSHCLVEIGAVVLGSTALVTNPAELFVSLGMGIRSKSPYPITLVAELANGHVGYVPTQEDFEKGGYETHRTVYTSRLALNAGNVIRDCSLELLEQVKREQLCKA